MGKFYVSENHQKPKQEIVNISNGPSKVFKFKKDESGLQEFISQLEYTPYSRRKRQSYSLSEYLDKETRTTAFMVIRNDTILFEQYFEGYNENSMLPSWSIAKSFTSALVGIAIQEGIIKKSDKIINYIPELKHYDKNWNGLTFEHLLNMRSGINFDEESYINPYSSVADLYMSKDIDKLFKKVKFKAKPGSIHYYSSLDTQIMGMALEKAIGKSLPQYLQEKIWKPLGMESDATWAVDSKKSNNTKAFCCLNITLRDYAKFASLYLRKGNWNGKQIIDSTLINQSIYPNFENNCYQNQWYSQKSHKYFKDSLGNYELSTFKDSLAAIADIDQILYQRPKRNWNNKEEWTIQTCGPDFFALGIFGQELYVDPENEMIFIRLGKKWDTTTINIYSLIKRSLTKYER